MQQRERTSQRVSETEEWTIAYGHGQLQSKRKRSQFERQTSWTPIIPQPSASGRMNRSFLDTWSWMLLHSQWFWREKNINVNRSHAVQSYFSKPSKQANMKLSLPDISTWLLLHPMSLWELSVHGGGRGEDHWTKKQGLIYISSSSFLLPNHPLLMAPAEDNTWPLMTRATFTNFVLPSPSQHVFASWGLSAASLLFSISFCLQHYHFMPSSLPRCSCRSLAVTIPGPWPRPAEHWCTVIWFPLGKASMLTPHFPWPKIQGLLSGFPPRRQGRAEI